jgi:hypothetical protein
MAEWRKPLIDMEMDDERQLDAIMPIPMPEKPRYPFGLCLSLDDGSLEKLDLDCDCDEGDEIYFMAKAKVTRATHVSDTQGDTSRVELQIVKMRVMDDAQVEEEMAEGELE